MTSRIRAVVVLLLCLLSYLILSRLDMPLRALIHHGKREFNIKKTWNGGEIDHSPVNIKLSTHEDGCHVTVQAPFFNDPAAPPGDKGKPFPKLWDYEVVELFFLNDNEEYLEVELCPHGQHLLLVLKGCRNMVQDLLPLQFVASIDGTSWRGETTLPHQYFPPNVTNFNAYAIHGSGDKRVYESLHPTKPGQFSEPDFHRLQFFQTEDFSGILKFNTEGYSSELWSKHTHIKS